jgi:feruloyl esterase
MERQVTSQESDCTHSIAIALAAMFFLVVPLNAATAGAASCESLSALALPDTTITLARPVGAGELSLPVSGRGGAPESFKDLPAFCRVAATLKPTSDSDIKIEVWLPATGWNRKYQAVGNGGWAGSISYPAMGQALRLGYATSSTDTGHTGGNGSFALGHPEKLIDFAWRSEHEMTLRAKAIVAAFYGDAPHLSYWVGCSSGGKQGLKEAQKFPDDYDGIVAGAPVLNWTRRSVEAVWIAHAALKDPGTTIPPEKYPLIHKAAIEACDALDGLKDGIISDPPRCRFDPGVLTCRGEADGAACLTPAEVEAARKIYTAPVNPRTGEQISPRFEPGSELGWRAIAGGPEPFFAFDYMKYVVFHDPRWDWRTFNFDSDVALADKVDNGLINAIDPNLKPFTAHHGKLIMYHGWTDTNITPVATINYYERVTRAMGGHAKTAESARLFMVPGMNHCGGGEGPNTFNMVAALEQWVEKEKAPDEVLAAHSSDGKIDRTRPLCPYPQRAVYRGSGDINDARNFSCKLP